MSRWGISGAAIPAGLPFALEISKACAEFDFPPLLAYAIAWRETIREYGDTAAERLQDGAWPNSDYMPLPDGSGPDINNPCGHGLYQETSSWPTDWRDPEANARYALANFLMPAVNQWLAAIPTIPPTSLVRAVAATFNAGFGGIAPPRGAWGGHMVYSNVDYFTANQNYGLDVLEQVLRMGSSELPQAKFVADMLLHVAV